MKESSDKKSRKTYQRILFSLLRIVVLAFLGLTIFLYFFQSHYIYRPSREIIMTPSSLGLAFEEVSFTAEDSVKLNGWFIPGKPSSWTVLFCHSNFGNVSHYFDWIDMVHRLGYNILLFDYRGYGTSSGKPSEAGTYLDAQAAWDYLIKERNATPSDIIIWGRSMGGAIASNLASNNKPRGLIIESAFTTFPDVAAEYYPYLPVRLIARYDYPTIEHLKKVNCPTLIVHSRDDEVIPFSHGQKLFESANPFKTFLPISGDHNDGYFTSGKRYEDGVKNFLEKISK